MHKVEIDNLKSKKLCVKIENSLELSKNCDKNRPKICQFQQIFSEYGCQSLFLGLKFEINLMLLILRNARNDELDFIDF